jgi:branched-chain amino acid transport system ATP-binding protein
MSAVLEVAGVGISFGGVRAVDDVSLAANAGEVLSIIGPNGAGKTTLFNIISGLYRMDRGAIRLGGADVSRARPPELARRGLSRTFQNLQVFSRMTVIENVMAGRHLHESHNVWAHMLRLPGTASRDRATRAHARDLLARVHLADAADTVAGNLSYGAMKRLEIARALATEPKVLLLDEPAAGCNDVETRELDELLVAIAATGVAVVLVEHDMKLVMSLSDRILVLDRGRVLTEGEPEAVARDERVIAAYLGTAREPHLAAVQDDHG